MNSRLVLEQIWRSDPRIGLSTNDLVETTGLTRATVLLICDELIDDGLIVPATSRPETTTGRPVRRFALNAHRAYAAGVDVGYRSVSCAVADLSGHWLATTRREFSDQSHESRTALVRTAIDQTIEQAGIRHDAVESACFGVAAPIAADGHISFDNPFWKTVQLDPKEVLDGVDWSVSVHNDANLAAIAERDTGVAESTDNYIALLAGERFGAGIVSAGQLLTGSAGGAGEMAYLTQVIGVGERKGIGALAREWAAQANEARSSQNVLPTDAHAVLAAATAGDTDAITIVERLADRLARVTGTLASLLNPDIIIISGTTSHQSEPLLRRTATLIPQFSPLRVELAASALGPQAVLTGAIRVALDTIFDRQSANLTS
ncbi:ROK family protein [Saccharopolyspora sp. NPDC002686]|uniref:ROK family protein n=1 Tax=Saccharopolyspora sp. NPDC002686 TaxID=3154541 RepID=UPI00331FE92E